MARIRRRDPDEECIRSLVNLGNFRTGGIVGQDVAH